MNAKSLKFKDYLVPMILDGSKVIMWRLFDDKDLQINDRLTFINKDTGQAFAEARIISMREKKLGEIEEFDFVEGHERFKNQQDMLDHYCQYYGDSVSLDTTIKIIGFTLEKMV